MNSMSSKRIFFVVTVLIIAVVAVFVLTKKGASRPKPILTADKLSHISDPFEKSKAVFAAVGDLITTDTLERGARLPSKKEIEEETRKTEDLHAMFWRQAPAGAIIQLTHFTNGYWSSWYRENQIIEMNVPFTTLLGAAYRTNGKYFSAKRMVFAMEMSDGHFDFLLNDTNRDEGSLPSEIKKQFNLKGRLELRETNVLVLKVKDRNAPALRFGGVPKYDLNESFARPLTTTALAETLEQEFFHQPVIDETRLAGTIYFFALPRKPEDLDLLKQILLEQSGLELVPDRRSIEMLVVEKAN
jgi:hypothetical protein